MDEDNDQISEMLKSESHDTRFTGIEKLFGKNLHHLIRRLRTIRGLTKEDAEDAVQSAFFKFLEKLAGGPQDIDNPTGYVRRIADHVEADFWRGVGRRTYISLDDVPPPTKGMTSRSPTTVVPAWPTTRLMTL